MWLSLHPAEEESSLIFIENKLFRNKEKKLFQKGLFNRKE
jgi:hypothetical protein